MVDALTPQLSGIGRYCWELVKGLPAETEISSLRFRRNGQWVDRPSDLISGEFKRIKRQGRIIRNLRKPFDRSRLRASLVHGPNYFLPQEVDKGIITIHDLSVMKFPEMHPAERVRQFEKNFQSSISRAVHIITDTEAVRQELTAIYNIPQEKITAIALGYAANYRPFDRSEIEDLLQKYGLLYGKYGLCVSTFEPRKKIVELLSAWRHLDITTRTEYPLVLAGASGWLNDGLKHQIDCGVNEGWLRNLGFVSEQDLPAIYGGAALFLYPSIYEGFGLPSLEAMACGVPVIVADQPCAREVCGDAATYVEPDNQELFTDLIRERLEDVAGRQIPIKNGLLRAGNYNWAKCVSETADLYRAVKDL